MDPIVKTQSGSVRGSAAGKVLSFKGIPYAAPPFGPNRFRAPQPVAPWQGVRDALTYGPTVPKPPYFPPFDTILPEPAIPGEECLNLNIWTPETGNARLPVIVWIHGGAFANGSNAVPTYDGSGFARDGVVLVSINYRLGVDGFLFLGDGISNLGMLDQIAALKWVQENIAAFGGDPDNVTIAGESAGGMSVGTLLSTSQASGLFRRAIAQSGAGHHAISPATAQRVGGYLAEKLGVQATREAIGAVAADRLLQAQIEISADAFANPDPQKWGEVAANLMPFEPVIDGELLTELPIKRIAAGQAANVDVLVGTNAEEQRLFMVPNGVIDAINDAILTGTVAAYGLPVEKALATYREARPDASAGDLMVAVVTDWFYRIPAIRLAEAQAAGSGAAYMYQFAWRSPQFNGRLGACHAVELPFVFDTINDKANEGLIGTGAPQELADTVHAAWVAFARDGNPGWPKYDLKERATMRFNVASEVVHDPQGAERVLWEGLR
jgi:para-nitrobenzyl esterase